MAQNKGKIVQIVSTMLRTSVKRMYFVLAEAFNLNERNYI